MMNRTIRILPNNELYERNNKGVLYFKNTFKKEYSHYLKHFKLIKSNSVLQVKRDSEKIGPFRDAFYEVNSVPFKEEDFFLLIKNLILKESSFRYLLDSDDMDFEYFRDLGLFKHNEIEKEAYIAILEKNKADFIENIESIDILDNCNDYIITIYKYGDVSYTDLNTSNQLSEIEFVNKVGVILDLFENVDTLEPIYINLKEEVPSPYSKLYVIMDYLKENRDTLPKEVIEALDLGAERTLNIVANSYRDKKMSK